MVIIELNTEEIRNTLEHLGYKYSMTYPRKESWNILVADPSMMTYAGWRSTYDLFRIVRKLEEEFNVPCDEIINCGNNIDKFYEQIKGKV